MLVAILGASGIAWLCSRHNQTTENLDRVVYYLTQINNSKEYLAFYYFNNKQEYLFFKIKPQKIILRETSGKYTTCSHLSVEMLSKYKLEDIFIDGFDINRNQNTRFKVTKLKDLKIIREEHEPRYSTPTDNDCSAVSAAQIIDFAIKRHKIITFSYTDNWNNKTQRIFSPIKMIWKGRTHCVAGFDHVKKARRIFAINKMKNIVFK